MKKFVLFLCVSFLASSLAFAQIKTPASSPTATVTQAVGLANVSVEYSRPAVRGRKIFGDLVPFGKVWRTGANKITNIAFDQDVMLNGQKVAKGTYALLTIPGEKEWTVIVNTDAKQWGAYEYDEKKDVLRLTVAAETLVSNVENLSVTIEQTTPTSANVVIAWEKTAARFAVSHDPHEQIMAEIKAKTGTSDCTPDTYFDAADYYYEKGIDLDQALAWAEKVVANDQKYWTYQLRARILAKLGQCDRAVEDAKISLEMAKKDGDDSYVKKNEIILKQCGK